MSLTTAVPCPPDPPFPPCPHSPWAPDSVPKLWILKLMWPKWFPCSHPRRVPTVCSPCQERGGSLHKALIPATRAKVPWPLFPFLLLTLPWPMSSWSCLRASAVAVPYSAMLFHLTSTECGPSLLREGRRLAWGLHQEPGDEAVPCSPLPPHVYGQGIPPKGPRPLQVHPDKLFPGDCEALAPEVGMKLFAFPTTLGQRSFGPVFPKFLLPPWAPDSPPGFHSFPRTQSC